MQHSEFTKCNIGDLEEVRFGSVPLHLNVLDLNDSRQHEYTITITRHLNGSDWCVPTLSQNKRLPPWEKWTKQQRKNIETNKKERERGQRKEEEEEEVYFSHHMASMPLGHHHHQPAAAAPQPPQFQAQAEVPRRSSDMETDKVLPLYHSLIVTTTQLCFPYWVVSGAPVVADSPHKPLHSRNFERSTSFPRFSPRRRFSPATPLIGVVFAVSFKSKWFLFLRN